MSSRVTRSSSQREVIHNEASNDSSSAMDDDNESTHSVQAVTTKSRAGKGTWTEKMNQVKVKPWKKTMRKFADIHQTVGYTNLTDNEIRQWAEEKRKREEQNNVVPHFLAVTLKPATAVSTSNSQTNHTPTTIEEQTSTLENNKPKTPEEELEQHISADDNINITEAPSSMNQDETLATEEQPQNEGETSESNPFGHDLVEENDDDDMDDFMRDDM